MTPTRAPLILTLILALFTLVGCGSLPSGNPLGGGVSSEPLHIVAATELDDLGPVLDRASEDLGFDIVVEAPAGTLANSQALKSGEFDGQYDATWFATNRYLSLIGGSSAVGEEHSIATSPVGFGMHADKAAELGWDDTQPTWNEIIESAEAGEFTFGMTDPASSNSGFTALTAVATALADTGQALSENDIERVAPDLQSFFVGQTLTSGSSGWLADTFLAEPERADAIVNYESVLHSMNDEGADLSVIIPADGVISADYPLAAMENPTHEGAAGQVDALADWLLERPELMGESFRRPVDAAAELPPELADAMVIELPFPGSEAVTDTLLDAYNNELRAPGRTAYVLDTSGSMDGERMDGLRQIMTELIDGTAQTTTGSVGLRDREEVVLVPFATGVEPVTEVTVDRAAGDSLRSLQGSVDALVPEGHTALYPALVQAFTELSRDQQPISTIVLMSDGEANEGINFNDFVREYQTFPAEWRSIPVFVILYGEANVSEMEQLAALTGGEVFDALDGDLAEAFKEIRAYQ